MSRDKKWILKDYDDYTARIIADGLKVPYPIGALLAGRGCESVEQARSFLYLENDCLHDPFLLDDMDRAVVRICAAADGGEKITIYGDYDVDGITSVSTLYLYLKGYTENVEYYIPDRGREGYGLNREAIDQLAEGGTGLIITVDTGITAVEEIEYASSLGLDVVVTDHHECKAAIPQASAVVNPKRPGSGYPFTELAGVGVVFKLLCACEQYRATGKTYTDPQDRETNIKAVTGVFSRFADLVSVGTVADVMPLVKENRLIVSAGLHTIPVTKNKGLAALLRACGLTEGSGAKKLSAATISFTLAPRINAVGRIGEAKRAVQMLLTEDDGVAETIAAQLCEMNTQRQSIEAEIMSDAAAMMGARKPDSKIIVLAHDNWHHGIIGIVSSRLTDKYNLPSILVSFEGDDPDVGKGSGRSIEGFNLLGALTHTSSHLIRYGGHSSAAGLTVSRGEYESFKAAIEEYARENITDGDAVQRIYVDMELEEEDITLEAAKKLAALEPFGAGNPMPVFLLRDVIISSIAATATRKHTIINLRMSHGDLRAVMFGITPDELMYRERDCVDILFNLGVNEYKNYATKQMFIRDIRPCGQTREKYEAETSLYEDIRDDRVYPANAHIPDRDECAAVFRCLKEKCSDGGDTRLFATKLCADLKTEYIKLRLITDIFSSLALIECRWESPYEFTVRILPQGGKTPLTDSELFCRLQKSKGI